MSEQDGTQSSTKQHRSRKTSTANQQNSKQVPAVQRPANDDTEAWKAYWKAQGQLWRTEPEIDFERQQFFAERRSITAHIEQGIYPFKDIQLCRADVEWLLATHENGQGPVNWSDEKQRTREGVDLRGAVLREINLERLPLACLRGGLTLDEAEGPYDLVPERYETAAIHLESVKLWFAHLEGAIFNGAYLEKILLSHSHMEEATLGWVHLENSALIGTNLENAYLLEAHLEGAQLDGAILDGARLSNAHLEGAALWGAFFSRSTRLDGIILTNKQYGGASLADVHWGEVNITDEIDWSMVKILGEESHARQKSSLIMGMLERLKVSKIGFMNIDGQFVPTANYQ